MAVVAPQGPHYSCHRGRKAENNPETIMYNPTRATPSTANSLKIPIMSPQSPPPSIIENVRREARGRPMRKRSRTSLPTLPPRLRPKARHMTMATRAKAAKFREMYPCAVRVIIHKAADNITNISQVYLDTSMHLLSGYLDCHVSPPSDVYLIPTLERLICRFSRSVI